MRLEMTNAWTVALGTTAAERERLRDLLSFLIKGARYVPAVRARRWDGRVSLFEGRTRRFPTGLVPLVAKEFADVVIEDARRRPGQSRMMTFQPKHEGRPVEFDVEQLRLIEAVRSAKGRGIIESPTGSGKTQIMGQIVADFGVRTLWLVHTKDLLEQTVEVLENALGEPVGVYGGGKKHPEWVTVGMIQTLAKDIGPFTDADCLVIDEVHHSTARTWLNTAQKVDAFYRYGCSGTVVRNDQSGFLLGAATGRILAKATVEQFIGLRLAEPLVRMVEVYHEEPGEVQSLLAVREKLEERARAYRADKADRRTELAELGGELQQLDNQRFQLYYEKLIVEGPRNLEVLEETIRLYGAGKLVLVMVKRKAHGRILERLFVEQGLPVERIDGDDPISRRREVAQGFRDKEKRLVIVTEALWGEGIDVPAADCLINAAGGKSEILTKQKMGRVLRKKDGANRAFIVDFDDIGVPMLERHSIARRKIYKPFLVKEENGNSNTGSLWPGLGGPGD